MLSNDIELHAFPNDEYEALAMLYIQNQDLSGLTPEQLLDMYHETYDKICIRNKNTYQERSVVGWSAK